ncbi:RNA polymerase sigma factor FliA [Alcaligenaceae bacterium SJ-26]|nr:RNA polymerase sigma factor FliA [Alcaligenaceae bacterium SJ-26]
MQGQESELIERHAPLVRKLALQLVARLPSSVELDDLIQAGMIGLLDAVRRYQKMPQAGFETYATQRIRGAMLDELRSQDWLPRSVREKARRIEQAIHALEQSLGRAPRESEIAAHLELGQEEYLMLLQDAQGVQILHYEDFEYDGDGLEAVMRPDVAAANGADPLESLLGGNLREVLVQAIDALPEREKLLLALLHQENMNLKEVAVVMGVTEGRVCQLRTQAINRIRARIRDQGWDQRPDELVSMQIL